MSNPQKHNSTIVTQALPAGVRYQGPLLNKPTVGSDTHDTLMQQNQIGISGQGQINMLCSQHQPDCIM